MFFEIKNFLNKIRGARQCNCLALSLWTKYSIKSTFALYYCCCFNEYFFALVEAIKRMWYDYNIVKRKIISN